MSCNRENISWQSPDKTWNSGFYDFTQIGEDHEWDVEYDFSTFRWVSTGWTTEEEAANAWLGANPGGGCTLTEIGEKSARLDAMALEAAKAGRGGRRKRGC